ncbi:MAG: hypothetical protein VXW65_01955 [Pseudomonadota bacterium]|nr:hypothetical protein [Pseudomonadota bacterium]
MNQQQLRSDPVMAHEVVTAFETAQLALAKNLVEMLSEHYTHQTERRGCGYTQATRVLAERINQPRSANGFEDLRLFADHPSKPLYTLLSAASSYGLEIHNWRNLDQRADLCARLDAESQMMTQGSLLHSLQQEMQWQRQLRQMIECVSLEESRLIVQLIIDTILPRDAAALGLTELQVLTEKPKVGSCPMAEKFFLDIAHDMTPRKGQVNIIVDAAGQPLLLEKLNMGDDHSCISLVPLMLNGVCLPVGSLLAAQYDPERASLRAARKIAGQILSADHCDGFYLLRLTTLAVSPANRKRAFNAHFDQQVANGLFSPKTTTVEQLMAIALAQL